MQDRASHADTPYKNVLKLLFFRVLSINLQILRTNNSFHQQFAKQTSSAAVTSDLFVVWYPGLWSKCLLIHGSFSGNPVDPQKAHIQSKPVAVLKKLNSLIYIFLSLKNFAINKINEWPSHCQYFWRNRTKTRCSFTRKSWKTVTVSW